MTTKPPSGYRKVLRGIPMFLVPRVVKEQITIYRTRLSAIHITREFQNNFTITVFWKPKDRSPKTLRSKSEGDGNG